MKLRFPVCCLLATFVAVGCMHHRVATPPLTPTPGVPPSTNMATIVTPDNSLSAKVVGYNSVGRFVVLSFPVGQMPSNGQTFFIYRAGLKVGQIRITGPQQDNDTVADIIEGDAQKGDDVRDQ